MSPIDTDEIVADLLKKYERVMELRIFVHDPFDDKRLTIKYEEAINSHNTACVNNISNIDAGFDLYMPDIVKEFPSNSRANKIDFLVSTSATMICDNGKYFNTGYYIHPRSSLSKTGLRLGNATGIIDSGYRGHLIGMFDNIGGDFVSEANHRYVQICAPSLVPIVVNLVNDMNALGPVTARNAGGFGSTGA